MELIVKEIDCTVNGEQIEVNVKNHISYTQRENMAKSIAAAVVTDEGEYKPWMYGVFFNINFLSRYTDFILPDDWNDDKLMEFCDDSNETYKNMKRVAADEIREVLVWADLMIEYRKECYKKGFGERLLNYLNDVLEANPDLLKLN